MKKIKNVRGYALEIAATGDLVADGDAVEVPDEVAKALLEQPANWAPATEKKAAKADDKTLEGDR